VNLYGGKDTGSKPRSSRIAAWLMAGMIATTAILPAQVQAAGEAVHLSESVFFTLEKASYSTGANESYLQFEIKLHNGSGQSVDFNRYGVRITGQDGSSYSAQLASKQNARVLAGKEQTFKYTSRISGAVKPEDLSVAIFAWDNSKPMYRADLGTLPVSTADGSGVTVEPKAMFTVKQLDSALPDDAAISMSAVRAYPVYSGDAWSLYVDVVAENLGNASFAIPPVLKYSLEDAEGRVLAALAVRGVDSPLLPGKSRKLTLQADVPDVAMLDSAWTLRFHATVQGVDTTLGSVGTDTLFSPVALKGKQDYLNADGKPSAVMTVESMTASSQKDGLLVQANVRVKNEDSSIVANPALSAMFQMKGGSVSVKSADIGTHSAYLEPRNSDVYQFQALFPFGISVKDIQMIVTEKSGKAVTGTGGGTSDIILPVLTAEFSKATTSPGTLSTPVDYTLGNTMSLLSTGLIDSRFEVSMPDLNLFENVTNGYMTAVATFKMTNRANVDLPIPEWASELVSDDGKAYSGVRQSGTMAKLGPNMSYAFTFSYLIPTADSSKPVTMRIFDGTTVASNKLALGAWTTNYNSQNNNLGFWSFYPLNIKFHTSALDITQDRDTETITLDAFTEITKQEQVLTDLSSAKLIFELTDYYGTVLSSQSVPLQGKTSGFNKMQFTVKDTEYSHYVRAYVAIDTPNGTVRRLLATFQ